MKEKLLNNWATIIFNLAETIIIITTGIILHLKIKEIILIILLFGITRISTKEGMHYKSWIKCLIWSVLLITSLFILVKIDIRIAIIMTIFSAIVTSKKADIKDWSMYRNERKYRKYRELEKYIETQKDSLKLKNFEKILKNLNEYYGKRYKADFYNIYKLYFIQRKSFEDIIKITNLYDNHELTRILDIVFISFNTYMEAIGEKIEIENYKEELATLS